MTALTKWRPRDRSSYMRGFPEEVYDPTPQSHLRRVMDALCSDPGVGRARKELMVERAQTDLECTRLTDLDELYSAAFGFRRRSDEEYSVPADGLATWEEWRDASEKDSSYRMRCLSFMRAIAWGGTRRGVELCCEAACKRPCRAIAAREFYSPSSVSHGSPVYGELGPGVDLGVEPPSCAPDGALASEDGLPAADSCDYEGIVVVAMGDDPITDEERLLAHDALSRVAPLHASAILVSQAELCERMVFEGGFEEEVPIRGAQASSHWWNVVRMVTGRPDWEYKAHPHLWVEPNVEREAPRQLQEFSQEDSFDLTPLVTSATASSEHEGPYPKAMAEAFPALSSSDGATPASSAVSRASSRIYSAGTYGPDVVDWSYPVEYLPEVDSRFSEDARSARWWSSADARSGTEWLEVELKRPVPVSRIEVCVSKKPVRVVPYLSSGVGDDGEREWVRAKAPTGGELAYSNPAWGGDSVGSPFVRACFEVAVAEADAVRLVFERLPVPYRRAVPGDPSSLEEVDVAWSVDACGLEIGWDVLRRADFREAELEDAFGNLVRTRLRECPASCAVDGDPRTRWVSQPDVSGEAVEWLVLDLRDESGAPQRVGWLDVVAPYGGCRTNAYSSDDGKAWVPYPEPFTLRTGRVELQDRVVSYVKLEFTGLCGIPYHVVRDGINVLTLEFPSKEVARASALKTSSQASGMAARLLMTPGDSSASCATVRDEIGAADGSDRGAEALATTGYSANLFYSGAYRSAEWSAVSGAYGSDMAREATLSAAYRRVPSAACDSAYVRPVFHDVGPHEYRRSYHERTLDAAFVVGISSIRAGRGGTNLSVRPGDPLVARMGDSGLVGEASGWSLVAGERMVPDRSGSMCVLQTRDLFSAAPFRSFDLATYQRDARQLFSWPSDMSREWEADEGVAERTSFGAGGTVLKVSSPDHAFSVTSEPKLARMYGVARFQVEVFPQEWSTWTVECRDAYREQVYSMTYRCEGGRWSRLGCVFNPQPGSGWWDGDYSFRVRVPLVGPVDRGAAVMLPLLDLADVARCLGVRADLRDVRLVVNDGVSNQEADMYVAGDRELWFRAVQSLDSGREADGSYDGATGNYVASYYVYFGNSGETTAPMRDASKVLGTSAVSHLGVTPGESGVTYDAERQASVLECEVGSGTGFASMRVTPTSDPARVPDGASGVPEDRYLMDCEADDGTRVSAYLHEAQLTLKVTDPDGFESTFVSAYGQSPLRSGVETALVFRWWGRGSADTCVAGSVDPSRAQRRRLEVWAGSPDGPLSKISNAYDEERYDGGEY